MNIIAEIGSVHDGSFGNAMRLIEVAAEAGATTVKFQTHIAEAESLANAPSPSFFSDESRIEYFKRTGFSEPQWLKMAAKAKDCKVQFLSSPFSLEAVDLLERVGVSSYKIPSGEVTNLPLLEKVGRTGKPTFLSSGMSDWRELDAAVEVLKPLCPLTVLQCSSLYPCPPENVGLNVIKEMRDRYDVEVGFSDHTLGFAAAFAAAALGASVVEKHFTYSQLMYGSDARHSMEPGDFRIFCQGLKDIWKMSTHPVNKDDLSLYSDMKIVFQKSIVTSKALAAGSKIDRGMLAFKKPGDGIPASQFGKVIGRTLKVSVPGDHKLSEDDFV